MTSIARTGARLRRTSSRRPSPSPKPRPVRIAAREGLEGAPAARCRVEAPAAEELVGKPGLAAAVLAAHRWRAAVVRGARPVPVQARHQAAAVPRAALARSKARGAASRV